MSKELTNPNSWTEEEMKLITEVIAPGANAKELELFLHRCKLMKLNPLKPGQIHFIKYGNSPGTIVVGIEGFRAIASRTKKLSGIKRGAIHDAKGQLVGGWAEVYRSDWNEPAREEVPLREYNTGKGPWSRMPETMIKKVAEAAALRMAFPDDLGGIYETSEMDQADHEPENPPAARTAPSTQAETPPSRRPVIPPRTESPAPKRSRAELGDEIYRISKELGMTDQQVNEWVFDDFKKAPNQMTIEEMEKFLITLQCELGRKGA